MNLIIFAGTAQLGTLPLDQRGDPRWRLGFYLAPSLEARILWQVFVLLGIYAAGVVPKAWSPAAGAIPGCRSWSAWRFCMR